MTDQAITGGQYCVKGLVQQLLVGLDRGLTVIIDRMVENGPMLVAATMTLEPPVGGDHDVETPAERIVEQVKIRTNGKAWTPGEIAEEMLPDLVKAVRDTDGIVTRYRLVTDGALNCGRCSRSPRGSAIGRFQGMRLPRSTTRIGGRSTMAAGSRCAASSWR